MKHHSKHPARERSTKARVVALLAVSLLAAACAAPGGYTGVPGENRAERLAAAGEHEDAARVYIGLAAEASVQERDRLTLLAVEQWLDAGDINRARSAFASVARLAGLLGDTDKTIASAAAHALGLIGNPEAAKALSQRAKKAPEPLKPAIADACLACAEQLLADGKKPEAVRLYKSLNSEDQPKHVRLAATRGLLAAAGKRD